MAPVEKSHSDGLNGALAAILRAERAAQRLSIADLVAHMGISKSTVIRLLAGDRAIDVAHLAAFAEAFGMDPAELMRSAEQRMSPIATVSPIRKHVTVDDLRGLARVADRSPRESPVEDTAEPSDGDHLDE